MLALASPEFLELSYRTDMHLLVGRWARAVSEDELYAGYRAMQTAPLPAPCSRWLVDSRRRPTESRSPHHDWVIREFLPAVQRALATPLRVAFVVLPDYHRNTVSEGHVGNFLFARFIDEGAAYAWLVEEMGAGLRQEAGLGSGLPG